jgi:hypothetical protein
MPKNYQNNPKLDENQAKRAEKYEVDFKADYVSDWDVHSNYINQNFDAYEAMLQGQVYDSISGSVDGSKITDSFASTLTRDRADRIAFKLPDGETESAGKADMGKAAFMDILRQKWIYPNANAQRPFKEKINLWQLYSGVYGYMPMFYDWNTSSTGYVGPDCWLWNPRNLVPQQGKVSIEDMDYVTALTWVSKKRLENILEQAKEEDGWDTEALGELISIVDGAGVSGNDNEKDTQTERSRIPQGTKKGICLATRYESGEDGRWCTFAPDHGYMKLRDLPNPHKNGRIPFVIKYSQPLFDSFYGMGDFQRAKPLQFARDGLTNFYFASLKRNLAPGIIANANGVVKHTLDVTRANPVLLETIPNSIRPFPTNTAGLSTYQGAMSNLTGSLLSQYGTQNASMPGAETLNPEQGKTPAAIKMFSAKEDTRDGAEQRHLEVALEQLIDGFFSLVVNIGTEDIPVSLFAKDIEEIAKAGLEDVLGIFTQKFTPDQTLTAGDLRIDPRQLRGIEYRFNINPGSTAKISKAEQLEELERYLKDLAGFQNLFQDDPRVQVHPDKIAAVWTGLTDIKGAEEFITVAEGPSPQELQLQQQLEQMAQENQQLQAELAQKEEEANAQPEPVVSKSGMIFKDPQLAQVADQITSL